MTLLQSSNRCLFNYRYVYYEGDCIWNHLNPYVPVDVEEPSNEAIKQNFLKGVPQETIDACSDAISEKYDKMLQGKEYDVQKMCYAYSQINKHIIKERGRLGGDWAVAQAVPTRKLRDHIRSELGQDLIFVVLHMARVDQEARIKARHGDEDSSINDLLSSVYQFYEPAAEDEPNTIDLRITPEMSPVDVVNRILEIIGKKYDSSLI